MGRLVDARIDIERRRKAPATFTQDESMISQVVVTVTDSAMPACLASHQVTPSQAPISRSSSAEGNLAIHKAPVLSGKKLALGRAPPSDAPGATSTASQRLSRSRLSIFLRVNSFAMAASSARLVTRIASDDSPAIRVAYICQTLRDIARLWLSLPLDRFRGLETRMNTSLHSVLHSHLPSFIPSKSCALPGAEDALGLRDGYSRTSIVGYRR